MLIAVKIFVALSILWAIIALAAQVVVARGGGRRDYSKRSGSPGKGLVYNFTVAMLPAHKETVRRHPVKFAVGVVMHVGVILSMAGLVLLLVWPTTGHRVMALIHPLVALALLAGIYLFARRVGSASLRAMSAPEDYTAILATCGFLALASLYAVDARNQLPFLACAGLLFVYLPLGKLRHAVFFFVARADLGQRLGYRGVYPPSARGKE